MGKGMELIISFDDRPKDAHFWECNTSGWVNFKATRKVK